MEKFTAPDGSVALSVTLQITSTNEFAVAYYELTYLNENKTTKIKSGTISLK
jgi:hypothetical protein